MGSGTAARPNRCAQVEGSPLAVKPDLVSLLRCRWAPGVSFTAASAMHIAGGVAAALAELHRLRICHGDVYAHNVLATQDGQAVLLDYGDPASTAFMPLRWHACTHTGTGMRL